MTDAAPAADAIDAGRNGWGTIGTGKPGLVIGAIDKPVANAPRPGPGVAFGSPTITGTFDTGIVRRYLKRNIAQLKLCYERQLQQHPGITGTITVAFTIGDNGMVVAHTATGLDANVADCVSNVIGNIRFPSPRSGPVKVSYPLTFSPPQ